MKDIKFLTQFLLCAMATRFLFVMDLKGLKHMIDLLCVVSVTVLLGILFSYIAYKLLVDDQD